MTPQAKALRSLLLGIGLSASSCLAPMSEDTATSATTKTSSDGASKATTSTSTTTTTTTATATTGSSTVDGETETEGCTFLNCADAGEQECEFFAPDCPEGTKCMPWADDDASTWNSYTCAPLDPNPVEPGEVCRVEINGVSGIDNCAVHSMCWDVDPETLEGLCIAFCEGTSYDNVSCGVGFNCTVFGDPALWLCLPSCDPLLQDCFGDDTCLPSDSTFICVLDASGPDVGAYADPCEIPNGCDPGLYCLPPTYVEGCQGAGCCTPWCDTTKPPQCPGATQECISWFEEGQGAPGYEDVGICGIPE